MLDTGPVGKPSFSPSLAGRSPFLILHVQEQSAKQLMHGTMPCERQGRGPRPCSLEGETARSSGCRKVLSLSSATRAFSPAPFPCQGVFPSACSKCTLPCIWPVVCWGQGEPGWVGGLMGPSNSRLTLNPVVALRSRV